MVFMDYKSKLSVQFVLYLYNNCRAREMDYSIITRLEDLPVKVLMEITGGA
jgi:hypothetical protein